MLHRLIDEPSVVQARLVTPVERPVDYELVWGLGHKIRNKLHLVQLWAELGLFVQSGCFAGAKRRVSSALRLERSYLVSWGLDDRSADSFE